MTFRGRGGEGVQEARSLGQDGVPSGAQPAPGAAAAEVNEAVAVAKFGPGQ